MIHPKIQHIVTTFGENVASIRELMTFDQLVMDLAIRQLEALQERLSKVHGFDNPRYDVSQTLEILKGIHEHDSLDPHYKAMLNQCNVLLVSYFSSAVGEIFRSSVTEVVNAGTNKALLKEDIRVSLRELREVGPDLKDRIGELFASCRDISFQDMQSIGRVFGQYFDYEPEKNEIVNDIILSQACRHVIVHNAAIADRKMVNQVRSAKPRTIKCEIRENDRIQFDEDEVVAVAEQMKLYVQDLAFNVGSQLVATGPGATKQ